jgi:hypothetical protein
MTEILVTKTAAGALSPADQQAAEYLSKLKLGEVVKVKATRMRNPQFHRKFFALLNLAFDAWEPVENTYRGEAVRKNFEQFRNDVTVLAGYYETAVTLKGETRLTAKSISFGSMGQDEFEALYSAVVDVVLARILTKYTRDDLDEVIERLLAFA